MRREVVAAAVVTAATIALTVVIFLRQRQQRNERCWKRSQAILRRLTRECALPVARLNHIADDMVHMMQSSSDLKEDKGKLDMFVSYTGLLPNGDEDGLYYGMNLRGEDFVMSCVRLGGKDQPILDLHREEVSFPSEMVRGTTTTSREVFDFVAAEVARFVMENPENKIIEQENFKRLGFTVSYEPYAVSSKGTAIRWKNFSMDHPNCQELTAQINSALEKYGVKMSVLALVPNEVGILAGGRYYHRDCIASVTLGSGTDAAYLESNETEQETKVISTNWGSFRSSHLPMTDYDKELDFEDPDSKVFEKLVAGTYLGEVVRRVLLKMAREAALFGDYVPLELKTPYILRSYDVADMHQDATEDREVVGEKLSNIFKVKETTPMVREIVAEVCDVVSERGARLAAAGIVAILKKLGRTERSKSVITIEGGLYEHYRVFRNYLHSCIWEMLGNDLSDNVVVEHSHGGPGFGAIFLAAAQAKGQWKN
ncbi:hypothetical protein MLD38_009296 [Melastoma candidum]|uniref:Uncharacterized protein n=1 Tax=Melastoma candidum TaxID=119954 RepID=A0ACB9RYE9_9MYRT|nr:hypothetical protein MLD38_009296 [Melastoma candidum]